MTSTRPTGRDADALLTVAECFGPTLQGEGPSSGRLSAFVRLGRCHLACAWCDEPQTWDWSRYDPAQELRPVPVRTVLAQLDGMGVTMVVVTGGEPLLQQRHLPALLSGVRRRGWRVEIETSGTIVPALDPALVDQWNVSPKLAHSANPADRRLVPDVLRAFEATGRAIFKFVVREVGDLDEVASVVETCRLSQVWVMPEGTDADTVALRTRRLVDAVIARGWNFTTRLHILAWGDRRGV